METLQHLISRLSTSVVGEIADFSSRMPIRQVSDVWAATSATSLFPTDGKHPRSFIKNCQTSA